MGLHLLPEIPVAQGLRGIKQGQHVVGILGCSRFEFQEYEAQWIRHRAGESGRPDAAFHRAPGAKGTAQDQVMGGCQWKTHHAAQWILRVAHTDDRRRHVWALPIGLVQDPRIQGQQVHVRRESPQAARDTPPIRQKVVPCRSRWSTRR